MIVKSFSGRTLAEAMEKVKNALGDSALIIETRTLKEPGLGGKRVGYEVVAGADQKTTTPVRDAPIAMPSFEPARQDARLQRAADVLREERATPPQEPGIPAALGAELAAIRKQLQRLAMGQATPDQNLGTELAQQLRDQGLPEELLAELDEAILSAAGRIGSEQREKFVRLCLEKRLNVPGEIDWTGSRAIMVVGPTGVGKTTTIAKLAGDLVLSRRKKVGLITIDTYRVGATDQLQTYADLLDAPSRVARNPLELAQALDALSACDAILIDTAGRSPADAARLQELKGFCRAASRVKVLVAVSATSGSAEFAAAIERFSILPVEGAILTKLDECLSPGRIYGCLRRHRLPVHYCTFGQEVPDDIATFTPERLVAPILQTQTLAEHAL